MGSFGFFAMDRARQSSQQIQPFATEALCNKAAEAIRAEINAPIAGQRVQTLGRIVCLPLKDK